MKARYVTACILITAGIIIAFLLLRPAPKPTSEAQQKVVQEPKTNVQETNPSVVIKQAAQPPRVVNTTNGPLAGACEMAAFINQILDSVPQDRVATRDHLRGIQAVFFLSDYVMAAKTNNNLVLSEPAIVGAFTNVTPDTSFIEDRIKLWAVRPGTLTDHYQSISEVPADRENIKSIKAALNENGIAIDTESDLLMDCIRYAVHNTGIQEMYGSNPKHAEATPAPEILNSLVSTGDAVFQHRFAQKYGMDPRTVTNLMKRIKNLRLYNLSPADVEIPVAHFQRSSN